MNFKRLFYKMPVWLKTVLLLIVIALIATSTFILGKRQYNAVSLTGHYSPDPSAVYAPDAGQSETNPSPSPCPSQSASQTIDQKDLVWLAEPEVLGDLKLLALGSGGQYEDPKYYFISYYKVGSVKGKDLILALVPPEGPSSSSEARFIKNDDEHYQLLLNNSQDLVYECKLSNTLASNVTIDRQTTLPNFDAKTITYKGVTLERGYIFTNLFSEYGKHEMGKLSFLEDIPQGKLYSSVKDLGKGILGQDYLLRRPDGTISAYQSKPAILKDDNMARITWNDGTKNKDLYRADGVGGCGEFGKLALLSQSDLSGLKQTGKTDSGEPVYEFTSASSPIISFYFEPTGGVRYDYDHTKPNEEAKKITFTKEEFLKQHAVFVYKDKLDRQIVYSSLTYGPQVECGKPVIYLYPTEKVDVSVKVDAKLTTSEPAYNTGWKVTAEPSGQLINQDDKTYDSLFWEGMGHYYPEVTEGSVVKQQDIETTLHKQMTELGLTEKESADFLEFWLPKMPTTPYVRLTWFGTQAMDRLAPLHIEPKPDSVIRVFLDFAGLEQPINLKPQQLNHIPRNGFTVIEWGGLLKN